MKKLLIIMTLFMSSFFLFSLEDVKADVTFTVDVKSCINDDFFVIRDNIINTYGSTYDYIFVYEKTNNRYSLYLFDSSDTVYLQGNSLQIRGADFYTSPLTNVNWRFNLTISSTSFYVDDKKIILDSSMDIFTNGGSFNIYYNDFSYVASKTESFPTYYKIYLDILEIEAPHNQQLSMLQSFYNIVIEKLGYLGEILVNNYIYLSIIVIFMLIFVFKLIFRRFL